jgi:hypothetical protein
LEVLKPSISLDYSEEIDKKMGQCSCTSADGGCLQSNNVPMIISNGNPRIHGTRGCGISVAQSKIAALDEQRLESAWLYFIKPLAKQGCILDVRFQMPDPP